MPTLKYGWAEFSCSLTRFEERLLPPPEQILCLKSADVCKQFFVPFEAVSQGFTEISAANRESLNWTSGSVICVVLVGLINSSVFLNFNVI